jgi:hypothetical protein
MLALGVAIAGAPDRDMATAARTLFQRALPGAVGLTALRARASVLLGCVSAMTSERDSRTETICRRLAASYAFAFGGAESAAWPWPEPRLTYENALLVRALIVAGDALGDQSSVKIGLQALDWLIANQVSSAGHFAPIGNGWWPNGGPKSRFDQQPIEATSLLLAAESALAVTGADRYRIAMDRAYAWFLGDNDLGLVVAQSHRGAAFDGLTPSGVNTNQGAESTLMWLMAASRMHARGWQPSSAGSTLGEPIGASR